MFSLRCAALFVFSECVSSPSLVLCIYLISVLFVSRLNAVRPYLLASHIALVTGFVEHARSDAREVSQIVLISKSCSGQIVPEKLRTIIYSLYKISITQIYT